ncbi:hypothetical protein evm_011451 [Chilo suppressalis]|nr:hypothetical protein evm_011451 [Chilo suppressalis]
MFIRALSIALCCACAAALTPLSAAADDNDCALYLSGPGRTSAYDYSLNLLKGNLALFERVEESDFLVCNALLLSQMIFNSVTRFGTARFLADLQVREYGRVPLEVFQSGWQLLTGFASPSACRSTPKPEGSAQTRGRL